MKTGRKPSRTDPEARRRALKERARYRSKSKAERENIVDSRDRDAQQKADQRRHERDKPKRLAKQREQNAKERSEGRPQLKARAKAYMEHGSPKKFRCAECGDKASGFHHPDYDNPEKVTALCSKCHGTKHQAR